MSAESLSQVSQTNLISQNENGFNGRSSSTKPLSPLNSQVNSNSSSNLGGKLVNSVPSRYPNQLSQQQQIGFSGFSNQNSHLFPPQHQIANSLQNPLMNSISPSNSGFQQYPPYFLPPNMNLMNNPYFSGSNNALPFNHIPQNISMPPSVDNNSFTHIPSSFGSLFNGMNNNMGNGNLFGNSVNLSNINSLYPFGGRGNKVGVNGSGIYNNVSSNITNNNNNLYNNSNYEDVNNMGMNLNMHGNNVNNINHLNLNILDNYNNGNNDENEGYDVNDSDNLIDN
jgi:hypothetical protein